MQRIGIIQFKNFYIAAEKALNPKLEGRPIVVVAKDLPYIMAASSEAKNLGSSIGYNEKIYQMPELTKMEANYDLYRDFGSRVIKLIHSLNLVIINIEIDYLLVDLTFLAKEIVQDYLMGLEKLIYQGIGIKPCVKSLMLNSEQAEKLSFGRYDPSIQIIITGLQPSIYCTLSENILSNLTGVLNKISTKLIKNKLLVQAIYCNIKYVTNSGGEKYANHIFNNLNGENNQWFGTKVLDFVSRCSVSKTLRQLHLSFLDLVHIKPKVTENKDVSCDQQLIKKNSQLDNILGKLNSFLTKEKPFSIVSSASGLMPRLDNYRSPNYMREWQDIPKVN